MSLVREGGQEFRVRFGLTTRIQREPIFARVHYLPLSGEPARSDPEAFGHSAADSPDTAAASARAGKRRFETGGRSVEMEKLTSPRGEN